MSPTATPHSGTDAPKKPGVYGLFHTETTRALMVEVRLKNGTLMVRWRAKDCIRDRTECRVARPHTNILWTRIVIR